MIASPVTAQVVDPKVIGNNQYDIGSIIGIVSACECTANTRQKNHKIEYDLIRKACVEDFHET
jgi:hypothetical protein